MDSQKNPEPHIPIVPSVIFNGKRIRCLGNRIYSRPLIETFHEFLLHNLLLAFGKEWYNAQRSIDCQNQHVAMKWFDAFKDWTKSENKNRVKVEGGWKAPPSGEVQALMSFAYAVFCLDVDHRIPNTLIKRLRNKDQFQGALYEITVAAIMARAGFKIDFLENIPLDKSRCDFIARHEYTGIKIGVEAKSRHRKGVLNQNGEYSYSEAMKGDINDLLKKSLTQKPSGLPYIIFFDLNLPPTPHIHWSTKPWVEDIRKIIDNLKDPSLGSPDPFNGLIFTNFSYYYGGNEGTAPLGEYMLIIPEYSDIQLHYPQVLMAIHESCDRYVLIPSDI